MNNVPNPLDVFLLYYKSTKKPFPFLTWTSHKTIGAASDDGGFKYTQFYITQVTIYPCIFFMIFFSLVIIFIIMKQLKPVMKLYMSVIYYAFSILILFYASQILGVLVFDMVSFGNYKILLA